jgi:hypothetical protein
VVALRAAGRTRAAVVAAMAIAAWLALTGRLAAQGLFARFDAQPPPLLGLLPVGLLMGVVVAVSPLGKAIVKRFPVWMLVGVQVFRLPLELVMHSGAAEGVMPVQMSYAGLNFDIVTGITAPLVAMLCAAGRAPRGVLRAWNAMGFILLMNVVVIAVLSTPMFQRFGSAPRQVNTWVAFFPFVWLPAVLVPCALAGHLLVTRSLLRRHGISR